MSFRKNRKGTDGDMPGQIAYADDGSSESGDQPVESPATEEPTADPVSEDAPEPEEEPVPDGTSAEVLQWVGDDQGKAQRALDKEQADDKPRVGLTGELEKILAAEDDSE
jgi:hypothetical protein